MAWETLEFATGLGRGDGGPRATLAVRKSSGKMPASPVLNLNAPLSLLLGWREKARVIAQIDRAAGLLRLAPSEAGKAVSGVQTKGFSIALTPLIWVSRETRAAEVVPHVVEGPALVVTLPGWARPPAAAPAAPAPEVARPVAATLATPGGAQPDKMTAEREALFRKLWPDASLSVNDVLLQVNALPGERYGSTTSMYSVAKRLGFPTNRPMTTAPLTLPQEAADAEEREAETMVVAGKGAREIAEWFGWDLPKAQAFAARVRSRKAA